MAEDNITLLIDPETRDLVIDEQGLMLLVSGDETTAQCARLTLQTWIGEFFLDLTHGTEYERILGKKPHELPEDEIGEVIRAAIFQEKDVEHINNITADIAEKQVTAAFAATLYSGKIISMEVTT